MEIEVSTQNMSILECFSSETRVRIIEMLRGRPMYLKEIADDLQLSSAIVTKHIQKMEKVGMVSTQLVSGTRGNQKVCTLSLDQLILHFRSPAENAEITDSSSYSVSIPIGHYTNHQVKPTCGLASPYKVIGMLDDPRYFADPEHVEAHHLWFSSGFVEYLIPNYLIGKAQAKSIRITLEICSEAPGYNEDWPSDIVFSLNGINLGIWTCPGDFGSQKGNLTPDWWRRTDTQHGVLKTLLITEKCTFMDGVELSNINSSDLAITSDQEIRLRITSPENTRYPGGISMFGSRFGHYEYNIEVTVAY